MKIFIVAGHHRKNLVHSRDPGSVKYKDGKEVDNEHWMIERLLIPALKCFTKDAVIVCPYTYNLRDKIKWINKKCNKDDIVLSIHINAGGGTGTEVFYSPKSRRGFIWGKKISKIVSTALGIRNRGGKKDSTERLGIIRETNCTSMLLEMGFMDSNNDYCQLNNHGVQALIEVIEYLLKISLKFN